MNFFLLWQYSAAASEVQGWPCEGACRSTLFRYTGFRMNRCEIVEVSNVADAVGYPCAKIATCQCSECGIAICGDHTETCEMCGGPFCPSCLSFHQVQASHPKPVAAEHERRERKSA